MSDYGQLYEENIRLVAEIERLKAELARVQPYKAPSKPLPGDLLSSKVFPE